MDYPIYWEGEKRGLLRVSHVGVDTCFELTGNKDGLYRAWVEGEQGKLLLGIMENGCLRRRFSPYMTHTIGRPICGRLERVIQPVHHWRRVADNEFPLWPIPSDALCRKCGRYCELALSYREKEEFPLLPLFCFAKVCMIDGKWYAVFCFDDSWQPVMTKN